MATKLAWVTGSKQNGYEIVITQVKETKEFWFLNHKRFTQFRSAQDLCNAVNDHVKKKKRKRKPRKVVPTSKTPCY